MELTRWLGPAKAEPRFKHAFDRQLKFDTSANKQLSITEIKEIFEAGGSVSKVIVSLSCYSLPPLLVTKFHLNLFSGFSSGQVDFRRVSID